MSPFVPEFEGSLWLARIPDDFAARIRKRVEDGLLRPGSRRRSNYSVLSVGRDSITFGAADFLTAYNIGLNEVRVSRSSPNTLEYHVTFWRWTRTAVAHGLLIGFLLVVCVGAIPEARQQIASYHHGLLLFGGLAVFWCLLWPWLLTGLHRGFAEQALRQILHETLS